MAMSLFRIKKHIIPASHIREFPRATIAAKGNPPSLKLAVNQYIPRSAHPPSPGDLTLICCHANGFHKELYEAFFDELLPLYEKSGLRIRSIWAPDAAHQGESGVINEGVLGDDPSWNDLSRDIIHMVNILRDEMPAPIIGMGHSYGGHAVARASLMHPSLFTSLVLIDPVIEEHKSFPAGLFAVRSSVKRRDIWPSREEVEKYFRSKPFYKSWDSRVLDAHIKHGIRDLPTATYPDATGVTLTTTKHQEVFTFLRPVPGDPITFDRPEPTATFRSLNLLKPPVLYIVGGKSPICSPPVNERKMERTPDAEIVTVAEADHLVPMEYPKETAEAAVQFLIRKVNKWGKESEKIQETPIQALISDDFLKGLSKL
ncbi:hypothetical protein RUND412_000775 [Rhizina undulata]